MEIRRLSQRNGTHVGQRFCKKRPAKIRLFFHETWSHELENKIRGKLGYSAKNYDLKLVVKNDPYSSMSLRTYINISTVSFL